MSVGRDNNAIIENFENDFDAWVSSGKPDKKRITAGFTSEALQSIGVEEKYIIWDTSKINRIQREHPGMSDNVLKQIPALLVNPIIVMTSITQMNRVTIYGEVYSDNGIPVLTVLELLPISRGNHVLDIIMIANAYNKDNIKKTQNLINSSDILYICPDKEKTLAWLSRNQLQLPLGITKFGSIGKVTYFERDVNGNFTNINAGNENLPEWKTKLKEVVFDDLDSKVHEPVREYITGKEEIDSWLILGRCQLPFEISKYDSIGKAKYSKRNVNGNHPSPTVDLKTPVSKHYKYEYKHSRQTTMLAMLGNTSLWDLPKTAFLSSDKFSAGSVLKSYDWAAEMKRQKRCVISGFHSKLEVDIFQLLLKGDTPVIWALARGMFTRPSARVRDYLATDKLLIVSQFDVSEKIPTRERATLRNQFVIDNADEVVYAHILKGGMLSRLRIPDGVPLRVLDRALRGNLSNGRD